MRLVSVRLSAIGVAVAILAADADAVSRRKECRQACGPAVDACIEAGGKRKRCKRQTLKACRREGIETCAIGTTTTTTVRGATTTIQGGTTTTGATTTSNAGGTTTSTTAPGGTTTTLPAVHGCTHATAADRRAPGAARTVTFSSYEYVPPCIRIQAGQTVTFNGSFATHPLQGGEIIGGVETPDPQSRIPFVDQGLSTEIQFPSAGVFPYYCEQHGVSQDMQGAVYVDP
jgi:plastocyanin